jgi:hypothetical protein
MGSFFASIDYTVICRMRHFLILRSRGQGLLNWKWKVQDAQQVFMRLSIAPGGKVGIRSLLVTNPGPGGGAFDYHAHCMVTIMSLL